MMISPERHLPILVRFLERRVNQSLRKVPGTLVERFAKVQVQLQRRGRIFDVEILLEILTFPMWSGATYLARSKKTHGMSKNAIKQTIRRLRRVERELFPD
jgi:hypothetical protein